MPDTHVISALTDKAHELRQAVVSYEERLERTRDELAVVAATLTIMQRDGGLVDDARPAHVRNLFKRSEFASAPTIARISTGSSWSNPRAFKQAIPSARVDSPSGASASAALKAVRRKEVVRAGVDGTKAVWALRHSGPIARDQTAS